MCRHGDRDARAAAWRTVDRQHASQFVDALTDALQPEMMTGEVLRPLPHAAPVVLHHERQAALLEPQHDVDAPRARVLQRVGDRLETDAEQVVLVGGVEPRRRSLDAHVRGGRGAERHLPRQFGERAGEVAAFERLRAQIEHGSPRLFEAVAQHLPRHVERLLRA